MNIIFYQIIIAVQTTGLIAILVLLCRQLYLDNKLKKAKVEIESILTEHNVFFSMRSGVQDEKKTEGYFKPVCYIQKISDGRYQIDYYNEFIKDDSGFVMDNQTPNARIILYPSGIKQINFINKSNG